MRKAVQKLDTKRTQQAGIVDSLEQFETKPKKRKTRKPKSPVDSTPAQNKNKIVIEFSTSDDEDDNNVRVTPTLNRPLERIALNETSAKRQQMMMVPKEREGALSRKRPHSQSIPKGESPKFEGEEIEESPLAKQPPTEVKPKAKGKAKLVRLKRRHNKLECSDAMSVEYYRIEVKPQPVVGILTAKLNGVEMDLTYEKSLMTFGKRPPLPPGSGYSGKPPQLRNKVELFSPLMKPPLPSPIPKMKKIPMPSDGTPEKQDILAYPLHEEPSSEDDEELDRNFMRKDLSTDFVSGYRPSLKESRLTFRDSVVFLPTPWPKVPSIAKIDSCEDEESEKSVSPKHICRKQIALNDEQKTSMFRTDPELIPLWMTIRQKFFNEADQDTISHNAQPRRELTDYNVTALRTPSASEICCYEQEGRTFIESILPEAFLDFKFGKSVSETSPDQLHLFAWHNLGIEPHVIVDRLRELVTGFKDGKHDVDKMKCVAQYLYMWVSFWPHDFVIRENARKISQMLNQMANKTKMDNGKVDPFIGNYAMKLRGLVDALGSGSQKPSMYVRPLNSSFIRMESLKLPSYDVKSLTIDPAILVRHFMYIELEHLAAVQRRELVKKIWTDPVKKFAEAPNMQALTDRFNAMSAFIATTIIHESVRARTKSIVYWINCMEEARRQRAYQVLFEIDAALSCLPINRLELSWKGVPKKTITTFNHLHHITAPMHMNILRYKKEILEDVGKTVPFIGPFLTDLLYIYEGNSATKSMPSGAKGYNMMFQRAYQDTTHMILQDWGREIVFELDERLLEECRLLKGSLKTTEKLLEPSLRYEKPRDTEPAFVHNFLKTK